MITFASMKKVVIALLCIVIVWCVLSAAVIFLEAQFLSGWGSLFFYLTVAAFSLALIYIVCVLEAIWSDLKP